MIIRETQVDTYRIESLLEAVPRLQTFIIGLNLAILGTFQLFQRLQAISLWVSSNVIFERNFDPSQERQNSSIRDRELITNSEIASYQRLNVVIRLVKRLGALALGDESVPRRLKLRAYCVDEETDLSTSDGVFGEEC